ncbi:MAG TPA: AAA family ATPase, partial [bacterium]|nr:AAA family ATPase [bacterium]
KLLEIEGIHPKLLERIKISTEKIDTAVKELILIGFSHKWASRIYLRYGKEAPEKVKLHPYRLIRDFKGIGFKKAELIAVKVGIDALDEERIRAGIFFAIRTVIQKTGHTFLYLEELKKMSSRLLSLPETYLESEILSDQRLVVEEGRVYLPEYHGAEKSVAEKIAQKLYIPRAEIPDFKERMSRIEKEIGLLFSDEQKEAIRVAFESPLTVITGAAGTGKTTLCRGLLKLLELSGSSYEVCAPTGKAAYKLKSLTGIRASTIHRLFNYAPSIGFRVNEKNPLSVDYLIVDEASMVDLLLLEAVFTGIGKNTRVVFIGDPYQILPVEAGDSLKALVGSYAVSQVVLPKIFRQDKESTILRNATLVNMEKVFPKENRDDFIFFDIEDPVKMIEALLRSIETLRAEGYHPIREINVLTPLNKGGGEISVSSLNLRLRDFLNPSDGSNSFAVYEREF